MWTIRRGAAARPCGRSVKSPEHNLLFFTVLDAARLPGCMFCGLIHRGTSRHIESLLYEYINDVPFRTKWRASKGFCHRHSWMLAGQQDALALAILYRDLIRVHGENLLVGRAGEACSICEFECRSLGDYLSVVTRHFDDPELLDAIQRSDGLCGPHLRFVFRRKTHEKLQRVFSEVSASALKHLAGDLEKLVDSFDYRHPPAEANRIRAAWSRAIEKIMGAYEVPEAP